METALLFCVSNTAQTSDSDLLFVLKFVFLSMEHTPQNSIALKHYELSHLVSLFDNESVTKHGMIGGSSKRDQLNRLS